jgi:hypothetical protein
LIDQPNSVAERNDRPLVWPILIPVTTALLIGTAFSFGGALALLVAFLGTLIIAVWLVWVAASAVWCLWHRSWQRAASLIVALVLFFPAGFGCVRAGDYIHLALTFPYYETQIDGSDPDMQVTFDWGAAGLIPNYVRALKYDRSDELAKKVGFVETRPDDMETVTVRHLLGHWYLETQTW